MVESQLICLWTKWSVDEMTIIRWKQVKTGTSNDHGIGDYQFVRRTVSSTLVHSQDDTVSSTPVVFLWALSPFTPYKGKGGEDHVLRLPSQSKRHS